MFLRIVFCLFPLFVHIDPTPVAAQTGKIIVAQAVSKAQALRVKQGVQLALKILGFDPGGVDGKFGPKTRSAIRAYQSSVGARATGVLTRKQVTQLIAAAKTHAANRAVAKQLSAETSRQPEDDGRPTFRVFANTDLPGNDYRTPRTERGLKGIGVKGCGQKCADDSRCRAFTYNQKVGWCFLKSAAGNLTNFGSAVSGMKEEPQVAAPALVAKNPTRWSPARLRARYRAPSCRREHQGLIANLPEFELTIPDGDFVPGQPVEIKWQARQGLFPGKRRISLYIDVPKDLDVAEGEHEINYWDRLRETNPSVFLPYYPASRSAKRILIQIAGKVFDSRDPSASEIVDKPSGMIVVIPKQAGKLIVTAGLVANSTDHPTSSLKHLCNAALLNKPRMHSIDVKPVSTSQEFVGNCHMRREGDRILGPIVHVVTNAGSRQSVRAGEPHELRWSVNSKINQDCKTPLYLVLSMPERVRFEGSGFFALAPGARGPFGLNHDVSRMRVFVPLHIGGVARTGSIKVKIYQAGPFDIRSTLIEVPKSRRFPLNKSDFAVGRALITELPESRILLSVTAGKPRIVIQDRFTISKPQKTIYANDGSFELRIFRDFYRVVDMTTGELIVEREGVEPNFSVSARFVHALLENKTGVEIVDLFSKTTVLTQRGGDDLVNTGDKMLPIAWGRNDSFVLAPSSGGLGLIKNALIDKREWHVNATSGKHGVFQQIFLHVDLEQLTVAASNYLHGNADTPPDSAHTTWSSLLANDATQVSGKENPYKPRYGFHPKRWPNFSHFIYRWHLGEDTRFAFAPEKVQSVKEFEREYKKELRLPRNNRYSDRQKRRQLSSARRQHIRQLNGRNAVARLVIRHSSKKVARHRGRAIQSHKLARVRDWHRGLSRISPVNQTSLDERAINRISELTEFRSIPNHRRSVGLGPLIQGAYWSLEKKKARRNSHLAKVLLEHVNSRPFQSEMVRWQGQLGGQIKRKKYRKLKDVPEDIACHYFSNRGFVSPKRIMGWTGWYNGATSYWLIQMDCWGGSGWRDVQLVLLVKRAGKSPRVHQLLGSETRPENDLNLNSGKLVKGWLTKSELLLLAMPNGKVITYDVRARKNLAQLKNVDDAEITAGLHISPDGNKLIQVLEDGRIALISIPTQERLLNGYFIDDELIFYRDDGSYVATPEGAHFVHLKFPGVAGYHSFHQFEKRLRVPGLVKKVLEDKDIVRPQLGVPPRLTASFNNTSENRLMGTFTARSDRRVERIQVYQDGVLTDTITPADTAKPTSFDVARLPGTRWVSLLAIDETGLASQPVGLELGSDPRGASRIISLSIGINDYTVPRLKLTGAVHDANRIADAIASLRKEIGPALSTRLTDRQATREGILKALRTTVEQTRRGDTLVISYAGHGLQASDGTFYLTSIESTPGNVQTTGIAWREIADILRDSKARIVLLLDACQSGAAGTNFFATNDQAAGEVLAGVPSNIVVFAAAKGREFSFEAASGKGGIFSNAIAEVISSERDTHDLNRNGAIEISELFVGVKRKVVVDGRTVRENYARDNGLDTVTQTPWLARNQMVGDFALF